MRAFALAAALMLIAPVVHAQTYLREELRIPMREAGADGLEALLVRPDRPGKYPLALISHGAPRDASERKKMSPGSQLPIAMEFARRGFAAVIVMRRGYGNSGGAFAEARGPCNDPEYVEPTKASVRDLKAAISSLVQRSDIDGTRILAVGRSAGGMASVGLIGDAPPGLLAGISFAGGRGSDSDDHVCVENRLIAAFATFGKTARLPMLWVYADNDRYFSPALAEKFRGAFAGAGGNVQFVKAAAFGQDGHTLFSAAGIAEWTPLVDRFLDRHKLAALEKPMDSPPPPKLTAPPHLSERGRQAFNSYLTSGPHKAFAVGADGGFGWKTGTRSTEEAKAAALKFCQGDKGRVCRVVFVDDQPAP